MTDYDDYQLAKLVVSLLTQVFTEQVSLERLIDMLIRHYYENGLISTLWSKWSESDIQDEYKDNPDEEDQLTEEQIDAILRYIDRKHDAEVGINWDFISFCTETVLQE